DWIGRCDLKEQRCKNSTDAPCREKTQSQTDADADQSLTQDKPHHLLRAGAKSNANADLLRALVDSIRRDSINTHARHDERNQSKRREQRPKLSKWPASLCDRFIKRRDVEERKLGIHIVQSASKFGRQFVARNTASHHDVEARHGILSEWNVDERRK